VLLYVVHEHVQAVLQPNDTCTTCHAMYPLSASLLSPLLCHPTCRSSGSRCSLYLQGWWR
jgi:hypothetical protein